MSVGHYGPSFLAKRLVPGIPLVSGVAIFLMQAGMLFGPPPPSDRAMAATPLASYVLLAAAIGWLERGRAVEAGRPTTERRG